MSKHNNNSKGCLAYSCQLQENKHQDWQLYILTLTVHELGIHDNIICQPILVPRLFLMPRNEPWYETSATPQNVIMTLKIPVCECPLNHRGIIPTILVLFRTIPPRPK